MNPTTPMAMTADEVARELRMSVQQVYRMAREGVLPCQRYGRYIRFHRTTIERMLRGEVEDGGTRAQHTTPETSHPPDFNQADSIF